MCIVLVNVMHDHTYNIQSYMHAFDPCEVVMEHPNSTILHSPINSHVWMLYPSGHHYFLDMESAI